MFSVSESIMMANRKGLKADSCWSPTSSAMGSLVPVTSLTHPCLACTNTVLITGDSVVCFFPDQWTHSVSIAVLLCIFLAAVLAQKEQQLWIFPSRIQTVLCSRLKYYYYIIKPSTRWGEIISLCVMCLKYRILVYVKHNIYTVVIIRYPLQMNGLGPTE